MKLHSMIVILALSVTGLQPARALANESLPAASDEAEEIASLIQEYFPDNYRTMLAVARCESGLEHRDENGNLLPNQSGGSARGVFQVLMRIHRDEMRRLGLNPEDDRDYMEYVRRLYDAQGLAPWAESEHCWRAVA